MSGWEECMEIAVQVARRAAQVVREAGTQEMCVTTKSSPTDLVTEADLLVEKLIISPLKKKFPSHSFIGEESSAAGEICVLTDEPTWIIDPIDGTTNFIHRFPMAAVSIGFAVGKELEFGVINHCFNDTLYTARKGHGAFCNGEKLQVSTEKDVTKSLIVTEIGSKRDTETLKILLKNMETLLSAPVHGVRIIGSSALALCLVASGAAEAYYQFGLHCWDIAAAAVIIQEAGGTVVDTSGGPLDLMSRRVVAAGTQEMASYIAQCLEPISYERDDH